MVEKSGAVKEVDRLAAPISEYACNIRCIYHNSKAFMLLKRLFNGGQEDIELATASERKAMSRLVKAGLVTAAREKRPDDGGMRVRYSLTLAGRANYAATGLGLSLSQLCYLACARAATRSSFLSRESAFFEKDLRPMFRTLFPDFSPEIARKELTKKGFFVKRARRVSAMAQHIAEVEKYAAILDELYLWMKSEYKRRLLESMQDPVIARVVGHVP